MASLTVLIIGATGTLGRHIVTAAVRLEHRAYALERDPGPRSAAHSTAPRIDSLSTTRVCNAAARFDVIASHNPTHRSNTWS